MSVAIIESQNKQSKISKVKRSVKIMLMRISLKYIAAYNVYGIIALFFNDRFTTASLANFLGSVHRQASLRTRTTKKKLRAFRLRREVTGETYAK